MRPGQTAPEFAPARLVSQPPPARFNEAGADCPGIPKQAVNGKSRVVELQ